jgi:O-antigen/teichoic acid export membrane protein
MISLLARLGSAEIVGQYALGVAISVPVLMLAPVNRGSDRRAAFATDIRVMSLVFALFGIAAVGFLEQSIQERMVILIVAMAQAVEWIADLYAGERSAISHSLHGLLPIAVLGILVPATGRAGAGLLGVLIVRLLVLFFYDFRRPPGEPGKDGLETLFDSYSGNVPCYFIAHMLGYHWLGIFAAIASLTPAANVLAGALGEVATPGLAKCYQEDDLHGFRRMSLQMAGSGLMLGLCAMAGSIIAGRGVLGMMFGPVYALYSTLLLALAAAAGLGFVSHMLGCILTAGRRTHELLLIDITAIASTSLACVMLVSRLGIPGAAFATGFGVLVRITGQMWVLRSILRQPRKPVLLALLKEPLAQ